MASFSFLFFYSLLIYAYAACHPTCKECFNNKNDPTYCLSCYDGYYFDKTSEKTGPCIKCPADCLTCESKDHCLTCKEGYALNENNQCVKCDATCLTCTGLTPNDCTNCSPGYIKEGTVCVQCLTKNNDKCLKCSTKAKCDQCIEGFFPSATEGCSPCKDGCKTCDKSSCSECKIGYFKTGTGCSQCDSNCEECETSKEHCTKCPNGFYLNENTHKCIKCSSEYCVSCTGPNQCTTCADGYTVSVNGQTCESCPDSCSTCTYIGSEKVCITCAPGRYDTTPDGNGYYDCSHICSEGCSWCVDNDHCYECLQGYYLEGYVCKPCNPDSHCKNCEGTATHCTSCQEKYYFDESNNQCHPCIDNCVICSNDKDCSQCIGEYYFDSTTTKCEQCGTNCLECNSKSKCDKCKPSFFPDNEGGCKGCPNNCQECDSSDHCNVCSHEFYVNKTTGQCMPCATVCSECTGPTEDDCINCDPGYYFSPSNQKCFRCNEACTVCSGPNDYDCTECADGYFLNKDIYIKPNVVGNKCTKCEYGCNKCDSYELCTVCMDGYYMVGDDCERCSAGCKKCDGGKEKCTECLDGFYSSKNNDGTIVCLVCPQDKCKKCQASFTNPSDVSCKLCFDGYYAGTSDAECHSCPSNCLSCKINLDKVVCTSCVDGHLLSSGNCNAECSSSCLSCKDSRDNCLSCHNGFVLRGNKCLQCPEGCDKCEIVDDASICTKCLDGYYFDEDKCEKCDSSCATCYNYNPYNCYTCSKGFYKVKESTWPAPYVGQCLSCKEGLANCAECTSFCPDDYLNDKNCIFQCTKCADNFYYNSETNECSPCNSACKVCFGPEVDQCEACNEKFFLEGSKCVGCDPTCNECSITPTNCTSCNSGSYVNDYKCVPCEGNCAECESKDVCTKCNSNYYIFNGKCYQSCNELGEDFVSSENECKCKDGKYYDGTKCEQCKEPCATCNSTACLSCKPGYILNGAECKEAIDCSDKHCDADNTEGTKYEDYVAKVPEGYTEYKNEGNGGALRLINFGLTAEKTTFTDCRSENGGGGAIFIYNDIKNEEASTSINIKNTDFKGNKARFGAAIYIYSPSDKNDINIEECQFIENKLLEQTPDAKITGGCAIYLVTTRSNIFLCRFKNNEGVGGACKITQNYDSDKPDELSTFISNTTKSLKKEKGMILISSCEFQVNDESDCSLFISNDRNVQVKDCSFSGKLKKGAYHIDGHLNTANSQLNIDVKSCKFSCDKKRAFNTKLGKINSNDQTFNKTFTLDQSTMLMMAASALLVVSALLVTVIIVRRRRSEREEESHGHDELINSFDI